MTARPWLILEPAELATALTAAGRGVIAGALAGQGVTLDPDQVGRLDPGAWITDDGRLDPDRIAVEVAAGRDPAHQFAGALQRAVEDTAARRAALHRLFSAPATDQG